MDIKELIKEGKTLEKKDIEDETKKPRKKTEIFYETVLENDSDFVIERKTATTDKMLVCILSQGLLYLKNVKTGELQNNLNSKDILNFLGECPKSAYPTKIKYPLKNGVTHLSDYLLWAIKNLDTAKELVNKKIFINLDKSVFNNEFVKINDNKVKDLKWAYEFLDGFSGMDWNYSSYLYNTYNWLHAMEELGYSRDKIIYNKSKMIQCGFDLFKYFTFKRTDIIEILKIGNLDFNTFINYLVKLNNSEFLSMQSSYSYSRGAIFDIAEYRDYLTMQLDMYGKIKEKYPDNWLSSLQIMKGKYNIWQKLHKEEKFLHIHNTIKNWEYSDNKYCIRVPEKSSEIVDEGTHLGHCVGSYVDRIIKGETVIVFMRDANKPEESLVTVEVRDKAVVQYRGYADRLCTDEEKEFLKKWAKEKNLRYEEM